VTHVPRDGSWSCIARVRVMQDAVRTQLWPLPAAGVVLAVLLGVLVPALDARVDDQLPETVSGYLFGGGADAAQALLSAVAGSLITVTSLTFSLTVVTLQLASSQYSPRLLRTFARDRFVHVTLALFLSTFVYALTVLRTIRSGEDQGDVFVPQAAVTLAFVLAVMSVLGLVLFLAHLAREIRVETVLGRVRDDGVETLVQTLPAYDDDLPSAPPRVPAGAMTLVAPQSGFLTSCDEGELVAAATEADAVVVIDRAAGDSVIEGVPMARVWLRADGDGDALDDLASRVRASVGIGPERTSVQDVAFGLRQLTDVAVRALSPGLNDPTTAIHALGHSSAFLCSAAERRLGTAVLTDDQQIPRVVLARPDLAALLDLAIDQPSRYGATDASVQHRLLALLREVAWVVRHRDDDRRVVTAALQRIDARIRATAFDAQDREALDDSAGAVLDAVSGVWTSGS
jgi:uncharacterized membrane protein